MSLLLFIGGSIGTGAGQLPVHNFYRESSTSTVYSGVKFGSDGNVYARQSGGGWSKIGTWLTDGTNSNFTITRTTVGTLTTDAGAGPLALSSDRTYDVQDSTLSTTPAVTASVTFTLDKVSPSATLAIRTYVFEALRYADV